MPSKTPNSSLVSPSSSDCPLPLGTADVRDEARRKGDGLEAAARDTRYRFFEEIADHHRAHFVATAHTADDQAETILHRILRGTGVGGLRGMREWRLLNGRQDIALVRPLLPVRRAVLVQFLAEIGQSFREDPSNRSMRFTRNRIRHRLLPHLEEEYNPAVVEAILRLGETADGVQGIVHELVLDVAEEAVTGLDADSETATLDCRVLQGLNHHLIRELFVWLWREMGWPQQQMGLEEWDALALDAGAEPEANGNAAGKSGRNRRQPRGCTLEKFSLGAPATSSRSFARHSRDGKNEASAFGARLLVFQSISRFNYFSIVPTGVPSMSFVRATSRCTCW